MSGRFCSRRHRRLLVFLQDYASDECIPEITQALYDTPGVSVELTLRRKWRSSTGNLSILLYIVKKATRQEMRALRQTARDLAKTWKCDGTPEEAIWDFNDLTPEQDYSAADIADAEGMLLSVASVGTQSSLKGSTTAQGKDSTVGLRMDGTASLASVQSILEFNATKNGASEFTQWEMSGYIKHYTDGETDPGGSDGSATISPRVNGLEIGGEFDSPSAVNFFAYALGGGAWSNWIIQTGGAGLDVGVPATDWMWVRYKRLADGDIEIEAGPGPDDPANVSVVINSNLGPQAPAEKAGMYVAFIPKLDPKGPPVIAGPTVFEDFDFQIIES